MNSNGAIEKIYQSFERYYTVSTQNVEAPFVAEAVFKSHNEQYFLIKAAKVADIDSNDFVFFYSDEDSSGRNLDKSPGSAGFLGFLHIMGTATRMLLW